MADDLTEACRRMVACAASAGALIERAIAGRDDAVLDTGLAIEAALGDSRVRPTRG